MERDESSSKRTRLLSDSSCPEPCDRKEDLRQKINSKRRWQFTKFGKSHVRRRYKGLEFTVMTYNILSQQNLECNEHLYYESDPSILEWSYRAPNLLAELQEHKSDIICLQELEEQHYQGFFKPALEPEGYESIFKKKTGKQNDGCAIFFQKNMFEYECHLCVEFKNTCVKALDRDNVGVIVLLNPKHNKESKLVVATTHLLYNPRRGDVKLCQLRYLLAEVDRLSFKGFSDTDNLRPLYYPVILCGDMNSEPYSPLYNFLTCGSIRYENLKSGSVSGQRDGKNKGRVLKPEDLTLSALGINQNSKYETVVQLRNNFLMWSSDSQGTADSRNVEPSLESSGNGTKITEECVEEPSLKSSGAIKKTEESVHVEDSVDKCPVNDPGPSATLDMFETVDKCTVNDPGQSATLHIHETVDKYTVNEPGPSATLDMNDPGPSATLDMQEQRCEAVNEPGPSQKTEYTVIFETILEESPEALSSNMQYFSHTLNFLSAYNHQKVDGTEEASIYNSGSCSTVDYIFYNVYKKLSFEINGKPQHKCVEDGALRLLGNYSLLGRKDLEEICLPNAALSSDHTCLVSRFLLTEK